MLHVTVSLFAACLLLSVHHFAQAGPQSGSVAAAESQTSLDPVAVVVLPVEVLSEDPRYESLGIAFHSGLVEQLEGIDGLHLVDPALVNAYSGSDLTPAEIARQLGAATVVELSVGPTARGDKINIRLIDAKTGDSFSSGGISQYRRRTKDDLINEHTIMAMERSVRSIERHIFPDRQPDWKQEKSDAREKFLDASLSVEERVKALNKTRMPSTQGYPPQYVDGGAALTGEVALVAVQLAMNSDDPSIRLSIWRTMAGVSDPALTHPLLHSLTTDEDVWLREAAAIALASHLDRPGVNEALEAAASDDPARKVRDAAFIAQGTFEERSERLRSMALDDGLPERERLSAFFNFRELHGRDSAPADTELVTVLGELARTSTDPRSRWMLWFGLSQLSGPYVVEPLIQALSDEPDETVREWIVSALGNHIDKPGVREALEHARKVDSSLLVANAVEETLARASNQR